MSAMSMVDVGRMIETRGRAMLTVAFTSRDDLLLQEMPEGFGFDFAARISREGSDSTRLFAVDLKAELKAPESGLIELPARLIPAHKDTPFPVCLCYFLMHGDKGYYLWLVKPAFDQDGRAVLVPGVVAVEEERDGRRVIPVPLSDFTELDEAGLDGLVGQVNAWYDAR
jgi:hypothetical protein